MKLEEIMRRFNESMDEEKKKNCQPGQPYHSAKTGRFVDPYDEAGSWSIGKGKSSGDNCNWGQASRKSANKSQQFVKRKCGRDAKYRCRDGSVKEEAELIEDFILGPSGEILGPDLKNVSENDLLNEIERRIQEGSMGTQEILRLCSAINQSADGDFPKVRK